MIDYSVPDRLETATKTPKKIYETVEDKETAVSHPGDVVLYANPALATNLSGTHQKVVSASHLSLPHSPMSATMVGRNRFPCLFSKKCLAAMDSTGCSDSTSSLMVSVKGDRSLLASLKGSRSSRDVSIAQDGSGASDPETGGRTGRHATVRSKTKARAEECAGHFTTGYTWKM